MLIAAIITGLIALVSGITWLVTYIKDYPPYREGSMVATVLFWVFGFIWVVCFMISLSFNLGTQSLSGFIYSSEERFGYTTAHIRFSENAGTDSQPSFCVKTDSKAGKDVKKYVGSGEKVQVNIPPYFYFSNNPFACGNDEAVISKDSKE